MTMQTWFVMDMPLCGICVNILLLFLARRGGIVTERIKAFSELTVMVILASLTSFFYLQYDFGALHLPYAVVYFLDILYNFFYSSLGLLFMKFIRVTLEMKKRTVFSNIMHFYNCLMAIGAALLLKTTLYAAPSEAGRIVYSPLNYLWLIPQLLPVIITLGVLVSCSMDKKSFAEREKISPMLLFEVFNMASMCVMLFNEDLNLLPMAFCISNVYIFVTLLNDGVQRDELTGLSNRRRFFKDIQQRMTRGGDALWALYMMDLNDFKSINDTLGHSEGDKALLTAARALEGLSDKSDAYAYRYGGDEFIVIRDIAISTEAQIFAQRIQRALGEAGTNAVTKYPLSASIGYSIREHGKHQTIPEMIAEADSMMYEQKMKYKQAKAK